MKDQELKEFGDKVNARMPDILADIFLGNNANRLNSHLTFLNEAITDVEHHPLDLTNTFACYYSIEAKKSLLEGLSDYKSQIEDLLS